MSETKETLSGYSDSAYEALGADPARKLYLQYPGLKEAEESGGPKIKSRLDILSLIPRNKIGAEIGVFTGRFSRALINYTKPERLYLVDAWHLLWGSHFPNWNSTAEGKLETDAAIKATRLRTAEPKDVAKIVISESLPWLESLPPLHLDWVYLDSSHGYKKTKMELAAISPKMKIEGLIFLDDCRSDRSHRHHNVFRAVQEFSKETEWEIF
ncbi:class I SAM-dependent methyltransferase [Glycocaulis sp.]